MEKLSFDYDDKLNCAVAYVPGFRVRAVNDEHASNPWKVIDGLPPLLSYSDRSVTEYGDWTGSDPIAAMSDSFINRKWRELCAIFDMPEREARDHKQAYRYDCPIADVKRDLLNEWLDNESGQARVNLMRDLFNAIGWSTYSATSRGYSQSDWAELLLVYTPAHAATCGTNFPPRSAKAKAAAIRDLTASAELWGNWAWGGTFTAPSLTIGATAKRSKWPLSLVGDFMAMTMTSRVSLNMPSRQSARSAGIGKASARQSLKSLSAPACRSRSAPMS